jgi:hypothetical protein
MQLVSATGGAGCKRRLAGRGKALVAANVHQKLVAVLVVLTQAGHPRIVHLDYEAA